MIRDQLDFDYDGIETLHKFGEFVRGTKSTILQMIMDS